MKNSNKMTDVYTFTLPQNINPEDFSALCKGIFATAYDKFSCIDAMVRRSAEGKLLLNIKHLKGHRRIRLLPEGPAFEDALLQRGVVATCVGEARYQITA